MDYMDYEFITTIAAILVTGVSIIRFQRAAIRDASRLTDERFARVDERFARIDERLDKMDGRLDKMDDRFDKVDERFFEMQRQFIEVQKQFTEVQNQFAAVHAGIARLEGLIEGGQGTVTVASASKLERGLEQQG